ncbi:DNA glycosylase AlkZ-like family protein [Oleiharenicola lentus]|uniref:DNA glycosylase AlkZ-like family protein n=1 Tax=Oleiharenicola lentus TaxID=2508720 RepID=UPI003F66ABAD
MSATALTITPATARRFMRRALLLDALVPDVATALAHHGYVQIDPINVTGRMHDLILRNRVRDYREGDLMRHVHGHAEILPAERRTAFEHHIPSTNILVAFPVDAWPHLQAIMRARTKRHGAWSGKLTPKQKTLAPILLAAITKRGPMSSEDFEDHGRNHRSVWGKATLVKATLQKLFFHGELLIARRSESNRRYYDLPSRVIPKHILELPAPTKIQTTRWDALLKLRQRRLSSLKRAEATAITDLIQRVEIEGLKSAPLYCLREDVPLLTSSFDLPTSKLQLSTPATAQPLLLAPLDPLIYDRKVTSALWEFDYTWEVYTPSAKRKRGYYALPILSGHELVGHVDPKAHRETKKLKIMRRSVRRGHKVADAIRTLARWLGLK